jgi:predicted metal-dependent peptidase
MATQQLTASELKDFEFKISKAKTQIVLQHPFWAVILLKRKLILGYTIPTACIDRRSQITINPRWAKDFTVAQLQFLLCHEVGHEVFDHINRRGARNPGKWNKAGDAVINDLLKECKVGEFIEGGVDMPGSKDKTTDQIYNELPDDDGKGNGGGGPGGIGNDIDDSGSPMTQEEIDAHSGQLRVELAQAAQAAKMAGKLPGVLEELVAELLSVKTPWYDILLRYMNSFTAQDYSWARPNRRFIGAGDYLPSTGRAPTMGAVVIQVDISGSITQKELAYYNGHMQAIMEQCRPEVIHVIYTDTQVQRHEEFALGEEFALNFYSGGGTSMPAGFDWAAQEGIEPEVFITLTDGFTGWGEAPGYPVIWCISSDQVAAHGETIHFDMED